MSGNGTLRVRARKRPTPLPGRLRPQRKKYFLCPGALEVRNPESPAARRPGHALQDPPSRSRAHEDKKRSQGGPNRRQPRESAPPFMKMRKRCSEPQVVEGGGGEAQGRQCLPPGGDQYACSFWRSAAARRLATTAPLPPPRRCPRSGAFGITRGARSAPPLTCSLTACSRGGCICAGRRTGGAPCPMRPLPTGPTP